MTWKWLADRYIFSTKLSPEECRARLQARLAPWPNWRPNADQPVAGSVSPSGFSLTRAIGGRNSFQTVARGTFTNLGRNTQINLTLGVSPIVAVFGVIWIVVVVGILTVALTSASAGAMVAIPLGMLAVGVLAGVFGRFAARGEGLFLLRFLQTELDLSPGPEAAPVDAQQDRLCTQNSPRPR